MQTFYILVIQTNYIQVITFDETKMEKGSSNQSRLNKNVSYLKIPGQKRKDIRDASMRAIARPVLSKAINVCSDHFTKDSFYKSQELKRHLLGGNFKYIRKPGAVLSLFPNEKVVNQYHLIKKKQSNLEM